MSNELQLIKSEQFDGLVFDCYQDESSEDKGEFWATRTQIGKLLGYENPNDAIRKIHDRNKERMDKFSTSVKLSGVEGDREVTREVIMYSFKGLLEICRYSNQPVADRVIDFLWYVMDEIRKTGSFSLKREEPKPVVNPSGVPALDSARMMLELMGLKGNQLILSLDRVYQRVNGFSMLEATGITLIAPQQTSLYSATEIGAMLAKELEVGKISAIKLNRYLAELGLQVRINNDWQLTEDGENYGVVLEVQKQHGLGTTRQVKWSTNVLPLLKDHLKQ